MTLETLTVPQLKALCKERKLKGYSKLGRPALIQLLSDITPRSSNVIVSAVNDSGAVASEKPQRGSKTQDKKKTASGSATAFSAQDPGSHAAGEHFDSLSGTRKAPLASMYGPGSNSQSPGTAFPLADIRQPIPSDTEPSGVSIDRIQSALDMPPPAIVPSRSGATQNLPVPSSSLKRQVSRTGLTPQKKRQKPSFSATPTGASSTSLPLSTSQCSSLGTSISVRSPSISGPLQLEHPSSVIRPLARNRSIPNTVHSLSLPLPSHPKRFKPLVLSKPLGKYPIKLTTSKSADTQRRPQPEKPVTLRYLDFVPGSSTPALQSISLPPSLTQRKRVQCWAIILAELSDDARRQCILVSRMFRYAVYLSAYNILEKRYAGQRLKQMTQLYPIAMTNMWPYLRLRELEASERRTLFLSSYLGKLVKQSGAYPIAGHLWGSPDHKRQIAVVIRFILTRYWFVLSIGGRPEQQSSWLEETVLDAQEVIPHEVWSITIQKSLDASTSHTIYVIESTCEVVGHATPPTNFASDNSKTRNIFPIRADWSAYIHQHDADRSVRPATITPRVSLLDSLKWDGYEEYEKGISRLWLKRLSSSDEDETKLVVAKRYVLACVIGNGVSGNWMSTSEMAQEFAGMAARVDSSNKGKSSVLNLYLPSHHHVESVHFRTSTGEPLHPALASIQTLHREYFVLKDNGQEVGNEEHGVYEAWMEILTCGSNGVESQ